MATHGSVGESTASSETYMSYIERLKQYFIANDIKGDERQRTILLSICGASTYQLIRNIVSPAKPTDKTLDEIGTLVREHYFPKPSESQCSHLHLTPDPENRVSLSLHLLQTSEGYQNIVILGNP